MRDINEIVIHHSLTTMEQTLDKSIQSFDRTHAERLHPDENMLNYHIAYHWVIGGDGSFRQTRAYDEIGYHASNWNVNKRSLGICLVGKFDTETPSDKQLESLREICNAIQEELDIEKITGHREYSSKSCPGLNFSDQFIQSLFYNPIIMKGPSKKAEQLMENVDDMLWIKQGPGNCVPTAMMSAAMFHAKGNYPDLELDPDPTFARRLRKWLGKDPYSEVGLDAVFIDQKLDELKDQYLDIFCGEATLRLYGKNIKLIKEKEGINRDIVEIIKESYIDNGMPVIVGMTWTHWDYKVERAIPFQERQNNPTALIKHEATIVGMDNEYAYWYDNKYPKHSPGLPDGVNRMELEFLKTKGNLATNGCRGFLAITPEVIIND